jgi:hypothetical protein
LETSGVERFDTGRRAAPFFSPCAAANLVYKYTRHWGLTGMQQRGAEHV